MVISNLAEKVKITNTALKKSLVFLVTQKNNTRGHWGKYYTKFTKTENNNIRENVGERIVPERKVSGEGKFLGKGVDSGLFKL